jgi:polysaccharide biosynthesis protein PslJ
MDGSGPAARRLLRVEQGGIAREYSEYMVIPWTAMVAVCAGLVVLDKPFVAAAVLVLATSLMLLPLLTSWTTILTCLVVAMLFVPANLYSLPSSLPFNVEVYRIFVFALLLCWLVALLTDRSVVFKRTFLDGPLMAVSAAVVLSFVVNLGDFDPIVEFGQSEKAVLYVLTFVAMYYGIVSVTSDGRTSARITRLVVYLVGVLAVFGIFERFTGYNVFRHLSDFVPILQPAGGEEMGWSDVRGGLRVSGSAAHPIAFGTMLAMVLPLSLEFLLASMTRFERLKWGSLSLLITLAALLTVSRTAFLGIAGVLVALVVMHPKRRRMLLSLAVTGVVVLHLSFPGVIGNFVEFLTPSNVVKMETSTSESRLADYPRVGAEVAKKPLFGRGVGTFTAERFFYVDNQYLKYVAELGLFGLGAMLFLFAKSVRSLAKRGKQMTGEPGAIVRGAAMTALVYALSNATFDAQGFPQVPYLFYLIVALGVATALHFSSEARTPVPGFSGASHG